MIDYGTRPPYTEHFPIKFLFVFFLTIKSGHDADINLRFIIHRLLTSAYSTARCRVHMNFRWFFPHLVCRRLQYGSMSLRPTQSRRFYPSCTLWEGRSRLSGGSCGRIPVPSVSHRLAVSYVLRESRSALRYARSGSPVAASSRWGTLVHGYRVPAAPRLTTAGWDTWHTECPGCDIRCPPTITVHPGCTVSITCHCARYAWQYFTISMDRHRPGGKGIRARARCPRVWVYDHRLRRRLTISDYDSPLALVALRVHRTLGSLVRWPSFAPSRRERRPADRPRCQSLACLRRLWLVARLAPVSAPTTAATESLRPLYSQPRVARCSHTALYSTDARALCVGWVSAAIEARSHPTTLVSRPRTSLEVRYSAVVELRCSL